MIEYRVKVHPDGTTEWYLGGQLHREGGPAIELACGGRRWCRHGLLHREDGPAVELADGHKQWWLNGQLHREDGPAVECPNGTKYWHLHDQKITEAEHVARTQPVKEMTVAELESVLGHRVKVVK